MKSWPLLILLSLLSTGCEVRSGPAPISADVPNATGWRAEVVVDGLRHPWSIAWLPDGSALVTERPGRLRVIRSGRLQAQPISGLPPLFADEQGGLLDVALHPDFEHNHLVYLSLSIGSADANRTALARGRLDGDALRDVEIIFKNPDTKTGGQHFGSRLLWLPDGSLLMSIGDGGNPPASFRGDYIRKQAQNPGTVFGKIVHLNADGSPYPDNPIANKPGARPELGPRGQRTLPGRALDPDGRGWANEHGAAGGDELNLIDGGNNYGWPEVSYSNEYWGPPVADRTTRADVTDPILVWTPSKAPSGLVV
jgi:glucose/arabinose dehydrogenase